MVRIASWHLLAFGALLFAAVAAVSEARAETMELRAPDGRTVVLYDDFTWEYKRPAPSATGDTVEADALVSRPGTYAGEEVVVTGRITKLLGEYRLTSSNNQNNMVVNLSHVRRGDQIALDEALKNAGWTGNVRVQIQGKVSRGSVTHRLDAQELVIVSP